jgi:hypothetical protein
MRPNFVARGRLWAGPSFVRYFSNTKNTIATKFTTMLEAGGELSQVKSMDLGGCYLHIDPFARSENESAKRVN